MTVFPHRLSPRAVRESAYVVSPATTGSWRHIDEFQLGDDDPYPMSWKKSMTTGRGIVILRNPRALLDQQGIMHIEALLLLDHPELILKVLKHQMSLS